MIIQRCNVHISRLIISLQLLILLCSIPLTILNRILSIFHRPIRRILLLPSIDNLAISPHHSLSPCRILLVLDHSHLLLVIACVLPFSRPNELLLGTAVNLVLAIALGQVTTTRVTFDHLLLVLVIQWLLLLLLTFHD